MNEVMLSIIGGGIGAAVVSGIFNVVMWNLNNGKKEKQRDKDLVEGLKMLMYERVKRMCQEHIEQGCITHEELEDVIEMHRVYHNNLDGNGFLDSLMEKVKKLPLK